MADAERAARETLFLAATLAAVAVGAPPPFRGPAADSKLGELFIDISGIVAASGYALDIHHARDICSTTFREGIRNPDGSLDRSGFLGATADMISSSIRLQAPWLPSAHTCQRQNGGAERLSTQLYRASAVGDEQTVRNLVAARIPLNGIPCEGGWSALHRAAFSGHAGVVKILLDGLDPGLGANVDRLEANHMRRTALIIACDQGRESVVRELLAHGASVSAQDSTGFCALHTAVLRGDASIIMLLCAAPGAAYAITLPALRMHEGGDVMLTPLGFAKLWGGANRDACADVLRAAGAV
jgi:ankyrin repeat protein